MTPFRKFKVLNQSRASQGLVWSSLFNKDRRDREVLVYLIVQSTGHGQVDRRPVTGQWPGRFLNFKYWNVTCSRSRQPEFNLEQSPISLSVYGPHWLKSKPPHSFD